jgi:hypothetical protein
MESYTKFRRIILRIINEIKEDMYNKLSNVSKENTNEQLNEIRKTMQDMDMKFNKEIEILEKIKWIFWKLKA